METNNFQDRVKDEKLQLDIEIGELSKFVANVFYQSLTSTERVRLLVRLDRITNYSRVLGERIAASE